MKFPKVGFGAPVEHGDCLSRYVLRCYGRPCAQQPSVTRGLLMRDVVPRFPQDLQLTEAKPELASRARTNFKPMSQRFGMNVEIVWIVSRVARPILDDAESVPLNIGLQFRENVALLCCERTEPLPVESVPSFAKFLQMVGE